MKNQERRDAELSKKGEQEQAIQDTTTILHGPSETTPLPPSLTAQTTRQRTEWSGLFRRLMSDLGERCFTVPGLKKKATEEDMQLDGTESRATERSLSHSGGDAVDSAGHLSAKDWWRMARPSFSDRDDGSRQRAWTKTPKTLRHVAADRVANEKLLERGFMTQWDNRNASKARAFRMKVDEHTDQRLVDYLATQVTTNGAWKKRDKEDGERTRAQWEGLVPQAREWLDEQNPDTHVNILHISNLSSMATGIFLAHPRNLGEILEMRSCRPLAAVVPGTVDRVKETYPGSANLDMTPTHW